LESLLSNLLRAASTSACVRIVLILTCHRQTLCRDPVVKDHTLSIWRRNNSNDQKKI
jgi:hypothetical protein